ncbi:hypothetical protein KFL_000510270 [Klebsormidium nitens]|uniref:N-acetyltransferase domain-containing protein n=1 Tax=Klebsormidium nitens TaxID=105231 RepID=A0A1Y1HUW6_KLENI|nr:hypothetical protein KFL_000510270 [Klebsormidium nitens]|eukprot:GAQ80326.1 hypothetical protein KFL_000510270 [Klebsormidium nitens]
MQTAAARVRWLKWQLGVLDMAPRKAHGGGCAAAGHRTCRCKRPVSTQAAAPSDPSIDATAQSTSPLTPPPRRPSRLPRAEVLTVREARPEEYWEIADTHCGAFFPEVNPVLGAILRLDRVFSLAGSTGDPRDCRKMALVALESGPQVLRDESFASESLSDVAPLRPFVAVASAGLPFPGELFGGSQVGERGVIGTCTLDLTGEFLPRRRPRGKRRVGIAYISNMAVRLRRRRQGVARLLVRRAEAIAKNLGCRSMALHVEEKNVSARALYEREGFRLIKVPTGAVWPQPTPLEGHTLVMMMKWLGHPSSEPPTSESGSAS